MADYNTSRTDSVDHNHSGYVWKDETTKDILKQLNNSKTAFKVSLVILAISFITNIIFIYDRAHTDYSPQPYLSVPVADTTTLKNK